MMDGLELRTRAAVAALAVFGFNPGQRRGPDGRWIKMGGAGSAGGRGRGGSGHRGREQWRAERDRYNESVLDYAEQQVEPLGRAGHDSSLLADKIDNVRYLRGDEDFDDEIDELRGQLENHYGHQVQLPAPPPPPGIRRAQTPLEEDPLYRRRREEYNQTALDAIESMWAFTAPDRVDNILEVRMMPQGPERDELVDVLAEQFNQGLGPNSFEQPLVAPTYSGPRTATEQAARGTRPPLSARYDQRRSALARSVRTGALDEVKLAQGQMGETRRFTLADGTSAVYKRATRDQDRGWSEPPWTKKDQQDAEELASRVAAALGVAAPAVHRASDDEIYMEFMEGTDPGTRFQVRGGSPSRGMTMGQSGIRFGLLDTLIENTDRHAGNYLVSPDDEPIAIDHGHAFSKTHRMSESGVREMTPITAHSRATGDFALENFVSPTAGTYKDNPLTPADVRKVRTRLNRLRGQFERRGQADWHTAMMERLKHIEARATGTVDVLD